MLSKVVEPSVASIAKLVQVEGIDMALRELQFENAPEPTVVMPSGIAMDDKLLQYAKALLPMDVMDDEMAILFKELHP